MEDGGFRLLDGGLWAGNPIMVGLVEALTAFSVPRGRIRILSLGCGSEPYRVGRWKLRLGGLFSWSDIVEGAMHYQSLGALGQAQLLIGAERVDRLEPDLPGPRIALDDWQRAATELPSAAAAVLEGERAKVLSSYVARPAAPYRPLNTGATTA
jgi:hypothetical protein